MLTVLAAPAAAAAEEPGAGPLRFGDQFLLAAGFLAYEPAPLSLLAPGEWELGVSLTAANTFVASPSMEIALEQRAGRIPADLGFLRRVEAESPLKEPLFLLDGELVRGALRVRRGLRPGLEVEVTLPVVRSGGGGLDRPLEEFHGGLGLDQDGRLGLLRDRFLFFVQLPAGEILEADGPGASLGDVVVAARRSWARPGGQARLTLDAAVKLPTGDADDLLSSGSADLLLQGVGGRCRGRWCGYLGVGLEHLGAWRALGIGDQRRWLGMAAVERRAGGPVSWIFQVDVAETPFAALPLDDVTADSYRLSIGRRHRLGERGTLLVAFGENLIHYENGPDVILHAAFERRF